MTRNLYIGVDIGTSSVRAGLFTDTGNLLKVSVKDIQINNPEPGFYEQSSEDIWNSVIFTLKDVLNNQNKNEIKGISFCATCSLVVVGNSPISINKNGDTKWDIIMWMDHRAGEETKFINETHHEVLKYVGGSISLEMETPKILWLKRNLPHTFQNAEHFFDLADYIRWRATGSSDRSICCLVCKWTFLNSPIQNSWDKSYFHQMGLDGIFKKIEGKKVSIPGDSSLISSSVADSLGINPNVQIGFSMIDAHCGVLGIVGCGKKTDPVKRLNIICGTSNCHMALSREKLFVQGVWGPFYGVIFKDLYLNEGGQSAAGKLIDHLIMSHPSYNALLEKNKTHGNVLNDLEETLNSSGKKLISLTQNIHIWPDFHGNRSPLANPDLKGMISGLTFSTTKFDLAILYLATIQALAYGSKHIRETLEDAGHKFEEVVMCGGLTKSNIFVQMHADILQLPVLIPMSPEPVLLGAAISSAQSCCSDPDQHLGIVEKMAGDCTYILPSIKAEDKEFHDRKYRVFRKMVEDQMEYERMMLK